MKQSSLKAFNFLIIGILFLFSCKEKSKFEEKHPDFEVSEMPNYIKHSVQRLKKDIVHTHYFDTLSDFYAARKNKPVWLDKMQDSVFMANVFKLSDSVVYEGLKTEHYLLDTVLMLLKKSKKQHPPAIYPTLALADVYLSNFFVALWHDKVLGRTNPKDVLGMKYTLPFPNHPEFKLFDALDLDSGFFKISHYVPPHPDFLRLRNLLFEEYAKTEGHETIIDTAGIRKVVPGDSTWIVHLVANRMVELGLAPDSIIPIYQNEIVYKKHLAEYVKTFQFNSNLTNDGIIGKTTLKQMNVSRNGKIDEIRANIERVKWFGVEPPKPYVKVNIPEFMLYMYYPDSVKTLTVCVGKGKERYYDQKSKKYVVSKNYMDKPLNHETPQIYSFIEYVVLNPTWTVPSSIVGREMFYQIARDPGYLIKNNYQVLKNGEVINPYSINWKKLKPGNVPYTIRQNAGDDNSLGKIKFTFKNPFDVYMHDTPLKSKFKQSNRAVSHGCVRVQSPVDLTGFVLQQNVKRTYDDVLEMMGLPPKDSLRAIEWAEDTTSYKKIVTKTQPVRVENKMIVFFDYKTIVFDEFNRARFIFDAYDKNSLIIEAMNKW